ncbi:MAG: putative addiction module antidote protein [Treponema sp.]|nr:putative addiction module antidote protein [Treponema sp.]
MAKEKITRWNVLDYLDNEKSIAAYLQVAIEDNNLSGLIMAIGDVVRARGVNKMAEEMGVSREGLYKSFSGARKPNIETVFNALDKLGLKIVIQPKTPVARSKTKKNVSALA